jgi:hypothetical protein
VVRASVSLSVWDRVQRGSQSGESLKKALQRGYNNGVNTSGSMAGNHRAFAAIIVRDFERSKPRAHLFAMSIISQQDRSAS